MSGGGGGREMADGDEGRRQDKGANKETVKVWRRARGGTAEPEGVARAELCQWAPRKGCVAERGPGQCGPQAPPPLPIDAHSGDSTPKRLVVGSVAVIVQCRGAAFVRGRRSATKTPFLPPATGWGNEQEEVAESSATPREALSAGGNLSAKNRHQHSCPYRPPFRNLSAWREKEHSAAGCC